MGQGRIQNYISVSARFEPAAYKKEQKELLECENFETITELKSGSLRRTDFAESACWLRINGRYIPKELVILQKDICRKRTIKLLSKIE